MRREDVKINKNLDYYMGLPYNFNIQQMEDEGEKYFFIKVTELDGCMSDGKTMEEAQSNVLDAMRGWIEVALEHGDFIPEPKKIEDYSGKFVLRVPKSLHHRLAYESSLEGVTLNQYALYKLSR